MGCALGCLALLTPRVVMVLMVIFGDYLGRAYETWIWPLLGFFFMPYTTLAYAWAANNYDSIRGFPLVVIVIAVLLDLGNFGNAEHGRRRIHKRWNSRAAGA